MPIYKILLLYEIHEKTGQMKLIKIALSIISSFYPSSTHAVHLLGGFFALQHAHS